MTPVFIWCLLLEVLEWSLMFVFWNGFHEMICCCSSSWCLFLEILEWFILQISSNTIWSGFQSKALSVKYLLCIGYCFDIFVLFCCPRSEFLKLEILIYILMICPFSMSVYLNLLIVFCARFGLLLSKGFIREISSVSWTLIRCFWFILVFFDRAFEVRNAYLEVGQIVSVVLSLKCFMTL